MPKSKCVTAVLLLLTAAYILGALSIAPHAALAAPDPFADVTSHWAAAEIRQWQALGLAGGYSDGTFRPEQATSRGEFLAFANRAFGFVAQAEVAFPDVSPTHRWYGDIAKAVAVGYAAAYADGTFRPDQPLTRLEAGEMLYAILHLRPAETDGLARFTDGQALAGEQRAMLNAVVAGGYMGGFPGNTVRPQGTITRAQMVVILSRAAGRIYNQTGTYGPEQRPSSVAGNVTINKAGVRLRNMTIDGDLRLGQSIADGEVYLQNVTVRGTTWISGGGSDCAIATEGTMLNSVVVADLDHNVMLTFDEISSPGTVTWESGGSYQSANRSAQQPSMEINAGATGQVLRLSGAIASVSVRAEVRLQIAAGSELQDLNVDSAADNSSLEILGRVQNVSISGEDTSLHLAGEGKVDALLNSAQLSATISGELRHWSAQAPFQLWLRTGGSLNNLDAALSSSGGSITRDEGSALNRISLERGTTIQVDGVAQTESGSPPPVTSGGTGTGPGTGTIPGSGGIPKESIKASSAYVSMSSGSVTGTISNGVNGIVDLRSFADDSEVFSMTFIAPVGTTLDLMDLDSPGLGRMTLTNHLSSLSVSVDDLLGPLSSGSVSLGAMRALFGTSVTVKGVASHPNYLSTEVTLTVLLR